MKKILAIILLGMSVAACTSQELEIHTTGPVNVYSEPARPEVAGNQQLGTIPKGISLPVIQEILQKDLAAYEVEYRAPRGNQLHGYVLLGDEFEVFIRKAR